MTQSISDWPAVLFGEGTERVQGTAVREMNVTAGRALADAVRTTLGPRGMDKMLVSDQGKVVVTNDGASILDRMDVEHPAARALVDVAATQGDRVGDGTTTVVVLAGELLAAAADLFETGLHPTTVARGYDRAVERVDAVLDEFTVDVDPRDTEHLLDVANTAVTGKWSDEEAATILQRVVDAVLAVEEDGTVDRRRITRKAIQGGAVGEAELVDGLAIDMDASSTTLASLDVDLPRRIEDARLALVDDQLTVEEADAVTHVSVETPEQRDRFVGYEQDVYEAQTDAIANAGADVVCCQKSIDDGVRGLLAERGIVAVERTRQDEIHKLARATGAELVMDATDLTPAHVGRAGVVERRSLAGTELVVVGDCAETEQVSIVLRGGTEHVLAETKRLVDNCLDVVTLAIEAEAVVPGGGACETALAAVLRDHADSVAGRDQLAVEAFADALESIPRTLAESAGLDPVDALVDLRTRHHDGDWRAGVDVTAGRIDDVVDRGIIEPAAIKRNAIVSAADAATLLIGIDDVVAATGDGHADHDHDHGDGHGHGQALQQSTEGYPWTIGH